ncbi:citrate lyase subunit alpha [Desulfuromonas acetoxidans]|uniref:Citrate lyase alpha chain n=1 Tax=Desulfuromonas acetoxidans (strain DSM 684 / 11070) TaxID=281689 RepID=Q1JZB4_DESA6|nr:citrate lyase subunit alpha [Desulfuromonas acetoxidans]EAT15653.1 citrate lyase, alpha subunit [Desulfuromonas acetoxidans DSM 684]MBF0646610.1 citrate lyase subunit alpha [Desulfuromonas acetoxidans]NVD25374.1 citrate lyase subunit alpha [Desulfuromonas acetoxidans]NVE17426.1 citrate lyase subunit alpha [Desulfuromonas acetoxidans]
MARTSLGRWIPESFHGRICQPYQDPFSRQPDQQRASRPLRRINPGHNKVIASLTEAIEAAGLQNGMCIATHHHLRNGDALLGMVVRAIHALGLRDIVIASSSIHPVHAELLPYLHDGTIAAFECGVNGLIGELASKGEITCPITVRTHGGRARALMSGEVQVDVAFIAAPCCDCYGNINGFSGPSACGSLGYAKVDADYAQTVIAVTDNLQPYPVAPISIAQTQVDYVVEVERLGDPQKIVSTTTRTTTDPIGLMIAGYAAEVIEASGLLKDGFSFQTGSGGTSLAVAERVRDKMLAGKIKGSFGSGGITGYFVDMLEHELFRSLFDVQCFDLQAVQSIGRHPGHVEIDADMYANPFNRGAVVNQLDVVMLGATEVDVDFNVNVNTESNGYLLHNTGGHSDTAAGAKLSVITVPSIRGRLPIVRDAVTTITTPGETIDVIVTERGIAVNERHDDLRRELEKRHLPVKDIRQLQKEIIALTGQPKPVEFEDDVIAVIEYRDGTIIDCVRRIKA